MFVAHMLPIDGADETVAASILRGERRLYRNKARL